MTSSFEDDDGFARMDVDASTTNTEPRSSIDDCDQEFLPRSLDPEDEDDEYLDTISRHRESICYSPEHCQCYQLG